MSFCTSVMYRSMPVDKAKIRAMPMMPMLPAKAVSRVRPFFVRRLLKLSARAVPKDMEIFLRFWGDRSGSSSVRGLVSSTICPSSSRTMRVEYRSASSGLWVTMITSLSRAISFNSSMICTLVSESRAPVGSSAKRMSGSLTRARAMATRCICPPESWLGRLCRWSPRPTFRSTAWARWRRSLFPTPERVRASSTLARTLWWGIRL